MNRRSNHSYACGLRSLASFSSCHLMMSERLIGVLYTVWLFMRSIMQGCSASVRLHPFSPYGAVALILPPFLLLHLEILLLPSLPYASPIIHSSILMTIKFFLLYHTLAFDCCPHFWLVYHPPPNRYFQSHTMVSW